MPLPLPYPHRFLPDVTCITPERLRALGVSGLLLDIDGTLMQTRDAMPRQAVLDWMRELEQEGFILYILSNNKHHHRVKAFAEAVGLPWQNLAKKPALGGFRKAASILNLPPERMAMVGDQTFTDVFGARRFGCKAILVDSTDTYLWYFWPRRLAELPFRKERP